MESKMQESAKANDRLYQDLARKLIAEIAAGRLKDDHPLASQIMPLIAQQREILKRRGELLRHRLVRLLAEVRAVCGDA